MPKRALMDQGVECHQLGKCDPLQWPSDCQAVFQPCEAGYINPRKLILAQQKLAKRNNCTMLDDAVVTKVLCTEIDSDSVNLAVNYILHNSMH